MTELFFIPIKIERLVNFTKINFLKVYNNLTVTDGGR